MGRFNSNPASRQALMDALMSFGGRLSAGAATEGYGAFAPALNSGLGAYRGSLDEQEKKKLQEEALKRQAANDAFRQLMEQRRADQGDQRLQQGEDRMTAAEKRADADRVRREAEDAQRAADRAHDNTLGDERLSLAEKAARRSEATSAAAESRYRDTETRRDEQDRQRSEESKRNEAQAVAAARLRAAQEDYRRGDLDKAPDFRDLFDEELTARGLSPLREKAAAVEPTKSPFIGARTGTPSPTPRTTAPAGAPEPPRETPRVPAPTATRAPASAMPSSVSSLLSGNDAAARKAAELHASGVSWEEIERLLREARGSR